MVAAAPSFTAAQPVGVVTERRSLDEMWVAAGFVPPRPAGQPERTLAELAPLVQGDRRALAYANGAFTSAITELENTPSGARNGALFDTACDLGEFVEAGLLDRETVRQALIAASTANGHVNDDGLAMTKNTIKSAFRKVAGKPRTGIPESDGRADGPTSFWGPEAVGAKPLPPPQVPPGGPPDGPGSDPPGGSSDEPYGRQYEVVNPVVGMRWLLDEIGQRGLSGMLRRGPDVVYTSRLNEEGYIEPPEKGDDNGPATMRPVSPDLLVAELALNYTIFKTKVVKGKGEHAVPHMIQEEVFFPRPAVLGALASIDKLIGLRTLRGVTHTPMIRKDGSILDQPGFDVATGFLYLPSVEVPTVPGHPVAAEVAAAVTLLRGVIDEFKWAGEHDEVNFLGLLLTPLLRELCPPPYKLAAIMARQPGSGKSLLAEIIRGVHGGVFRSEMPHDDAELAKSLTGILTCTTAPVVQFDNVGGIVRSSRLAGLLTSNVYSDRVLGSTNQVDMANDRLWLLTGNNLAFGGDLIRRTLWVTIDPGVPDPHLRTGFKIVNIPLYVAEHRGEIIRALLILVRAWVIAGGRKTLRSSDSYAMWSATVRAILAHAGVPGEFDHSSSAQQTVGTDDEGWGEFLIAVRAAFGDRPFTIRELLDRTQGIERNEQIPTGTWVRRLIVDDVARSLVEALPAELHEKLLRAQDPRVIGKSLGRWFMYRVGRWAGELVAEKGSLSKEKIQQWRVRTMSDSSQNVLDVPDVRGV